MTRFKKTHAVVVGGGITGLAAAYYLVQKASQKKLPLTITLLEREKQLGGKIKTQRQDGFIIEQGPDSFLRRKPAVIQLSQELGLDKAWVPTGPLASRTYIVHQGELHPLPGGMMFGIPIRWKPFLKTGLISPWGKARALFDLFLPKQLVDKDESLGHFLRRRLGHQVVERITEPLLSGIYAGDLYALSLQATFPQFKALEEKYGSLIRGMKNSQQQAQPQQTDQNIPNSTFLSFQNGLFSLVEALKARLENSVQFRLSTAVHAISKTDDGYTLLLNQGETLKADLLILATPAYVTANLFEEQALQRKLEEIPYISVANVVLAFDQHPPDVHLDASGFLVPRKEKFTLTASTWTSSKWPHTAPQGKVLIRAYLGRDGEEHLLEKEDQELVDLVRKELKQLTGLNQTPSFWMVNRWPRSMPQYQVGHLERLQFIAQFLHQHYPGVFLAGAGYRGVGIPDCIAQGEEAANQAVNFLEKQDKSPNEAIPTTP